MLLRRERAMTAIAIMLDVAFHAGRAEAVSAADIAKGWARPAAASNPYCRHCPGPGCWTASVVRRAAIAWAGRRATCGWPRWSPPRWTRMQTPEAPAGRWQAVVVAPLWGEMEALCRDHLTRLTVADLIKRAAAAGVKRPSVEPLNFRHLKFC